MTDERKNPMISARLPRSLVDRIDFVTRNLEDAPTNRSKALRAAVEAWLPTQEEQLEKLGIITKKVRA